MLRRFGQMFSYLPMVEATAEGEAPRFRAADLRRPVAKTAMLHFDGLKRKVMVRNLSRSGMKIQASLLPDVGQAVRVTVNGLASLDGNVRWRRGREIGVEFDRRLSRDELARCAPANDESPPQG